MELGIVNVIVGVRNAAFLAENDFFRYRITVVDTNEKFSEIAVIGKGGVTVDNTLDGVLTVLRFDNKGLERLFVNDKHRIGVLCGNIRFHIKCIDKCIIAAYFFRAVPELLCTKINFIAARSHISDKCFYVSTGNAFGGDLLRTRFDLGDQVGKIAKP